MEEEKKTLYILSAYGRKKKSFSLFVGMKYTRNLLPAIYYH